MQQTFFLLSGCRLLLFYVERRLAACCFRCLSHSQNTSTLRASLFPVAFHWLPPLLLPLPNHVYVPMMTIAFLFLAAASISVWASASACACALPLARFLLRFFFHCYCFFLFFFVLHVLVGFSPLVYNFNKILLTNSGNGRQPRRRWRRWQGGIRQRISCPFLYLRLPTVDWRMPNRYYYYNNSGAVATTTATVAIACQRCTCRFCSLLCWHCILLRRFDNSFYLRQDEDEDVVDAGRRLFVCHLRSIPNPSTQPAPFPLPPPQPSANPSVQFSMAQQFSFFLMAAFPPRSRRRRRLEAFGLFSLPIPPLRPLSFVSFSAPKLTSISVRFYYFHLHFHSARAQIYNCIYVNFLNRWCA